VEVNVVGLRIGHGPIIDLWASPYVKLPDDKALIVGVIDIVLAAKARNARITASLQTATSRPALAQPVGRSGSAQQIAPWHHARRDRRVAVNSV
jgi:hypothetical protein